jgi:hypothetical protein
MALDLSELDKLPADARAKVEASLKRALSSELARASVTGVRSGLAADAFSRSRGAFFSRSKGGDAFRLQEAELTNIVSVLDDAAFAKFAERLSTLKKATKSPADL